MKTHTLTPFDIIIVGVIMFGHAVYSAISQYIYYQGGNALLDNTNGVVFDAYANYIGIASELALLAIVYIYLKIRKFDFRALQFNIQKNTLPIVLALFFGASIVASAIDYALWITNPAIDTLASDTTKGAHTSTPMQASDISLWAFAIVNGFFEEIYFLGIVLCARKWQGLLIIFSLVLRFAFHLYQGLDGAWVITSLGVSFLLAKMWLVRRQKDSLAPFFITHTLFDIFGLTWVLQALSWAYYR